MVFGPWLQGHAQKYQQYTIYQSPLRMTDFGAITNSGYAHGSLLLLRIPSCNFNRSRDFP
jgi:hypothetical protein